MPFIKLASIAALVLGSLLAGCAVGPTVNMNAADRATIKSVTMNTPPTLPAEMFFHGKAQSLGVAVGGLIGGVLAAVAAKEPKAQLVDAMKANGIDLPTILKTEFFRLILPPPHKATSRSLSMPMASVRRRGLALSCTHC